MPNIPCNLVLKQCLPCNDSPIANLSAEDPDVDVFIGFKDFSGNPQLGVTFFQLGCKTICFSEVSQLEADLCAERQARECVWETFREPYPPPNENPPFGPPQPPGIFLNSAQSCTKTCPDGSAFGATIAAGEVAALSQLEADRIAESLACNLARTQRICISTTSPMTAACLDTAYSKALTAIGGTPWVVTSNDLLRIPFCASLGDRFPYVWTLTAGALPDGLTLNECSGVISGTPTAVGSYAFTVKATDYIGSFQTKSFTMVIAEITTASPLAEGVIGGVYTQNLAVSPAHDQETEVWTIIAGFLTPGLTLSNAGIISGTPTFEAIDPSYDFTVQVRFTLSGSTVTCQKDFHLPMTSCPVEGSGVFGCPIGTAEKRITTIIGLPHYPLYIPSIDRVILTAQDGINSFNVFDFTPGVPVLESTFDGPLGANVQVMGIPFYCVETNEVVALIRTGAASPRDVNLCFIDVDTGLVVSSTVLGTTTSVSLVGSSFVLIHPTGMIGLMVKPTLNTALQLYIIDPILHSVVTSSAIPTIMRDYTLCYSCATRQLMTGEFIGSTIYKFNDETLAQEGTFDAILGIDAMTYIDGTEKLWVYSADNIPPEVNVVDVVTGAIDTTIQLGTGSANLRGTPIYNIKLGQWVIGMADIDGGIDNGLWMYNVHTFARTCDIRRDWDQAQEDDEMGATTFNPNDGTMWTHSATGSFHLEQVTPT